MLFDTDVLIWVFRGNERADRLVSSEPERSVSIVTYMELIQGARDRREIRIVRAFLADLGFAVYPLSEEIGQRAAVYMEEYALSGGMRLTDALVAATVVEGGLILCTADRSHYRAVKDLRLKLFRP